MANCSPVERAERIISRLPSQFLPLVEDVKNDPVKLIAKITALQQKAMQTVIKERATAAGKEVSKRDIAKQKKQEKLNIQLLSEAERAKLNNEALEDNGESGFLKDSKKGMALIEFLEKSDNETIKNKVEAVKDDFINASIAIELFLANTPEVPFNSSPQMQKQQKKFDELLGKLYGLYTDQRIKTLGSIVKTNPEVALATDMLLPIINEPEAMKNGGLSTQIDNRIKELAEGNVDPTIEFTFQHYNSDGRITDSKELYTAGKFNLDQLITEKRVPSGYRTKIQEDGVKPVRVRNLFEVTRNKLKKAAGLLGTLPNFAEYLDIPSYTEAFWNIDKLKPKDKTNKAVIGISNLKKFRRKLAKILNEKILVPENEFLMGEGGKDLGTRMHEEPIQYFRNLFTDSKLDSNLTTAIALELTNIAGMQGSSLNFNEDQEIERMLAVNNLSHLPSGAIKTLRFGGTLRKNVVKELGKAILANTNIKFEGDSLDGYFQERLETSLGEVAVLLGYEMGIFTDGIRVENSTMREWMNLPKAKEESTKSAPKIVFLKFAETKDKKLAPPVQELHNSFKDARKVFDAWFNSNTRKRDYTTEPAIVNESVKKSLMDIGEGRVEAAEVINNQEFEVIDSFRDQYRKFSQNDIKEMMGWKASKTVHKSRRDSQEGINRDIERRIEALDDLYNAYDEAKENNLDTDYPIYLEQRLAVNLRSMVDSNTLDYQNSKSLHRWAIGLKNWDFETDVNVEGFENTDTYMGIMLAIGLGMGVGVDDTAFDKSLEKIQEYVNANRDAIDIVKNNIDNKKPYTVREMQVLQAAIKHGGAHGHTLMSLEAYAKFELAQENKTPYKHTLSLEVDGKTNGAAFAVLQIAPEADSNIHYKQKQVGLFWAEDPYPDYASTKAHEEKFQDMYQKALSMSRDALGKVAVGMEVYGFTEDYEKKEAVSPYKTVRALIESLTAQHTTQFLPEFFQNDSDTASKLGRNLLKDPAMQVAVYGAGRKSAQRTVTFGSNRANIVDWTFDEIGTIAEGIDEKNLDTVLDHLAIFISNKVLQTVMPFKKEAQKIYNAANAIFDEHPLGQELKREIANTVKVNRQTGVKYYPFKYLLETNPQKFAAGLAKAQGKLEENSDLEGLTSITGDQLKTILKRAYGTEITPQNLKQAVLELDLNDLYVGKQPKTKLHDIFVSRVADSIGNAVYDGLTIGPDSFEGLIKNRTAFIEATAYMNNIYVGAFNALRKKAVEGNNGEPLTLKQETEIKEQLIAKGLYSAVGHPGTGTDAAGTPNFNEMIPIVEEEFTEVSEQGVHAEQDFSKARFDLPNGITINTGKDTVSSITHDVVRKRPSKDIGIKSYVLSTHAMDSAWITDITKKFNVAQMFDAILLNPAEFRKITEYANERFIKLNAEFSIMDQMKQRIEHIQKALENDPELVEIMLEPYKAELKMRQGDLNSVETVQHIYGTSEYQVAPNGATLKDMFPPKKYKTVAYTSLLTGAFPKAYVRAEAAKQNSLQNIQHVNQAMLPGVTYEVTDADRDSFPTDKIEAGRKLAEQEAKSVSRGSSDDRLREAQIIREWTEPMTSVTASQMLNKIEEIETVKVSPEHAERLKQVWDQTILPGLTMVDGIINTRFAQTTASVNIGEFISDGKDKTVLIAAAENAATSPVPLSVKEIAAHEYLHVLFTHFFEDPANFAYREAAERLYERAREVVKPSHFLPKGTLWDTATEAEKATAEGRWDHIFANPEGALDEFIAMARTNEQLAEILENTTTGWNDRTKFKSFASNPIGFILDLVVNLLGWLSKEKIRLQQGGTVATNVDKLLQDILQINQTQKETTIQKAEQAYISATSAINEKAKQAVYIGGREMVKAINKLRGKDSRKASFKGGKELERKKFKEYAQIPFTFLNDFMGEVTGNKHFELVSNLKQEILGLQDNVAGWRDRLIDVKHQLDQQRKNIKENTAESLESFFKNAVSANESRALTDVVIKPDMSALLSDGYSIKQLQTFLNNPSALTAEIVNIRNQIKLEFPIKFASWATNQAEGLGILLVQGLVTKRGLLTNAHDIVQQYTLDESEYIKVPNQEAAETLVDKLVSLEALAATSAEKKTAVSRVIDRDAEAVETVMHYHAAFKQKSLEDNFKGSKIGTWKGYTKENFAPDAQVQVAVDSKKQAAIMRKKGFKRVKALTRDSFHSGKPLAIYSSNIGLDRMNSGIISVTGERYKGSSILDSLNAISDMPYNAGLAKNKVKQIQLKTELEVRRMQNGHVNPNFDYPYLLPILDQNTGNTVNQRYVMSTEDKDTLLKRDDRIFETMGNMFASIHDKKVTPELNELALQRLEHDWDTFKDEKKSIASSDKKYAWKIASPTSKNQEERELYRMLPDSTKYAAKKYFPDGKIPIRKDLANYIVGTRDISITSLAKKLNIILPEDLTIPYAGMMAINIGDKIWKEVMQITRMRESILMPVVTVANMLSNILVLLADGIPPTYIIESIGSAIIGMRKYQKARAEITKLEGQIMANQQAGKNIAQLQARLSFLQSSMEKNPVHDLVKEGLFPAIVEDINVNALMVRDNKLIGQAGEYITEKAQKAGLGWVAAGAKELAMAPGSKAFQAATAANQYGDFVARYIQYQYNTKHKGMDKRQAVHTALTDFVFYDEPTDPRMKALNDYGFFMFSKFFLRIQRVYAKLLSENPANIALIGLIDSMVIDLDNVWIGDYFLNLQKAWNRLDLLPWDKSTAMFGLPAMSWLNPFNYAP